jgi:hypothetical protein
MAVSALLVFAGVAIVRLTPGRRPAPVAPAVVKNQKIA